MSTSTLHLGTYSCRKSATWDRRLYFPSKGRHAEDFFARKILRLQPGLNPRTWVSKASTLPLDHRSRLIYVIVISGAVIKNVRPRKMNRNTLHNMDHRQYNSETQETETWITFTHHSLLIRNVTDLVQHTCIYHILGKKYAVWYAKTYKNIGLNGVYKLTCQTCKNCMQARQTPEDEDLQTLCVYT